MSRRQSTIRRTRSSSNDRTRNILLGAESRLRRLARKRGTRPVKQAYVAAARKIHQLAR